jgi:hypothetical protein
LYQVENCLRIQAGEIKVLVSTWPTNIRTDSSLDRPRSVHIMTPLLLYLFKQLLLSKFMHMCHLATVILFGFLIRGFVTVHADMLETLVSGERHPRRILEESVPLRSVV